MLAPLSHSSLSPGGRRALASLTPGRSAPGAHAQGLSPICLPWGSTTCQQDTPRFCHMEGWLSFMATAVSKTLPSRKSHCQRTVPGCVTNSLVPAGG